MNDDAARLFRKRCAELPSLLQACEPVPTPLRTPSITTGIGGSEGPARLIAHALTSAGQPSRYVPITGVADAETSAVTVFSHSLSPNARLAVADSRRIKTRVLVTGTETDTSSFEGHVVRHAPANENGLLVRVLAPTLASFAGLRALAGLSPPDGFFDAIEASALRAQKLAEQFSRQDFEKPWAFITSGDNHEAFHGLRWKWLETLGTCDPPIYDVLSFAHGPLQRWHGEPLMLLALRTGQGHWEALATTATRCGHSSCSLTTTLKAPWSFFELDAAFNVLLGRALSLGVGHGTRWRGHGDDVALYDLGAN